LFAHSISEGFEAWSTVNLIIQFSDIKVANGFTTILITNFGFKKLSILIWNRFVQTLVPRRGQTSSKHGTIMCS
jgi:hypothetical protein